MAVGHRTREAKKMTKPAPSKLDAVLHQQTMEEIGRAAEMAESYAVSVQAAAHRSDEATVRLHLKELVICCKYMAKTYNDFLLGNANGQDTERHRPDKRPSDAVARG